MKLPASRQSAQQQQQQPLSCRLRTFTVSLLETSTAELAAGETCDEMAGENCDSEDPGVVLKSSSLWGKEGAA